LPFGKVNLKFSFCLFFFLSKNINYLRSLELKPEKRATAKELKQLMDVSFLAI
jgi:hypothetical protein